MREGDPPEVDDPGPGRCSAADAGGVRLDLADPLGADLRAGRARRWPRRALEAGEPRELRLVEGDDELAARSNGMPCSSANARRRPCPRGTAAP